jgi:hypothetical protein
MYSGKDIILRGDKPPGSAWLLNHFKGFAKLGWKGARFQPGVILANCDLPWQVGARGGLRPLLPGASAGIPSSLCFAGASREIEAHSGRSVFSSQIFQA